MLDIFLTVVFAIHALAFGRFYIVRGRRAYNLVFFIGFVALAVYYGHGGWCYITGAYGDAAWTWLRWAGLGLCAAAMPFFIASVARRARRLIRAS